ncbi:hypothetical protein [Phosphitispora sp. TUW77]|uniref:hypothetical protein n=1 Tax=Phosphitispora sp. TUW77 TaxID=3152361 RepID=UPI003AB1E660
MDERSMLEFLVQKVTSMDTILCGVKSDVTGMKSTLKEHTGLLNSLEHRTEENTAQLAAISETTNYNKGCITHIQTDIISIKETLGKHNTLLEVLAARSLKHEADVIHIEKLMKLSNM